MLNAGISAKDVYTCMFREVDGYENVRFTKKDCYNYINKQRKVLINEGGTQSLVNHFKNRAIEDAMFFHTIEVDEESRMDKFFWRDGRSRIDYDCLGDVVFDTTYRTSKYNVICAPFIGVNHHWQNIIFGCAFLSDERTSSFVWHF